MGCAPARAARQANGVSILPAREPVVRPVAPIIRPVARTSFLPGLVAAPTAHPRRSRVGHGRLRATESGMGQSPASLKKGGRGLWPGQQLVRAVGGERLALEVVSKLGTQVLDLVGRVLLSRRCVRGFDRI